MFIDQLTNVDSLPVLERMMQFAGARHRVIAHNVANLSTPDFRSVDVSVADFQRELGRAVDARRAKFGGPRGELDVKSSKQVRFGPHHMELHPEAGDGDILFHDRNNRDLERTMQDLAENVAVFRVASELHKQAVGQLRLAISERV